MNSNVVTIPINAEIIFNIVFDSVNPWGATSGGVRGRHRLAKHLLS
jgi:hypothetical protein